MAKDTGLGSLLLRRTGGQDEPPQPPENSDAQTSGQSERPADQPDAAPVPPQPEVLRDRCTLYLDEDVNQQLDIVARIERKQRSEVVTELLRQHLPRYRIDREA